LLQRFLRIPSERILAEKLAGNRDYRRICGFRRKTPSRGCFTYFRRNRFKEERFREAFNFMVGQAIALGAVKGYVLASTQQPLRLTAPETPRRASLIRMLMLVGLEQHTF